MFDFSFTELALVGLVALIVLGPQRLANVAFKLGHHYRLWRYQYQKFRSQWLDELSQVDPNTATLKEKDDES